VEEGGLQNWGQSELHSEALIQNTKGYRCGSLVEKLSSPGVQFSAAKKKLIKGKFIHIIISAKSGNKNQSKYGTTVSS
jgi:hypothetical protein